ncbi:MAG: anion permease [Phycisphaeraceae bacterium]|nr:anion permease [Phycisphaeraceae bacterium]MCW5754468.1 anion permease [Phycisphaeraceae bacterium]
MHLISPRIAMVGMALLALVLCAFQAFAGGGGEQVLAAASAAPQAASMTWKGWTAVGLIVMLLVLLASNRFPVDVLVIGTVALMVFLGLLAPKEALAGMSNEGMITVAVLYVVVCGLQETGAIEWLGTKLLGKPKGGILAKLRLLLPVSVMSGFMNNTPLVAMYIPMLSDWCRRHRISPSKMMLPLSYAAIMGGTLTLIGTSTNLVITGKWIDSGLVETHGRLHFFEIAMIGLPCLIFGTLYMLFIGTRILPERLPVLDADTDARSYTVEFEVEQGGPLAGKTIEQAGLRGLANLFLSEIEREGQLLPAVSPKEVLRGQDRLFFVGQLESIVDLQKIRGLCSVDNQSRKLGSPRPQRTLVEAVVSNTCPLLGRTVREGRFRNVYDAVVIAVARNGERVKGKIGDIELRVGDTLLLEAPMSFIEQHRNSRDFFLVSKVENARPLRHEKAGLALAIMLGMILIATLEPFGFKMLHAAVLAAGCMVVLRCCTASQARRAVDWQVATIIAASLALGKSLEVTGAAAAIGGSLVDLVGSHPWLVLLTVYLCTMLLTEVVTNNGAAVLMFSIAFEAAAKVGADFRPFAFAIMMAASASFSTPIGYQTNLMVMGPGGYRFGDYFRVGIPLNLSMWLITCLLIPFIWPLQATR